MTECPFILDEVGEKGKMTEAKNRPKDTGVNPEELGFSIPTPSSPTSEERQKSPWADNNFLEQTKCMHTLVSW
jgi:hypothetical protein